MGANTGLIVVCVRVCVCVCVSRTYITLSSNLLTVTGLFKKSRELQANHMTVM